jgi:multidrug efflux pump subunit AcrB
VLGFVLMYALLAVQFGRFVLPLVILATAPMALAGVVLGLLSAASRSRCTRCMAASRCPVWR